MRLTPRVAVGIAVVCGALAALLVYVYLRSFQPKPAQAPPKPADVSVVVPVMDVPPNTVLTAEKLAMVKLPADQAPKTALRDPGEAVGGVSLTKLVAQKPILASQVMARGPGLGLAGIVPPGMRAVTVAVDPVTGVAGLLKAGDRVDVVATFEAGENLVAKTILQDVELLALGAQTIAVEGAVEEEPAPEAEAAPTKGKSTKGAPKTEPAKGTGSSKTSARDAKTIQYPNATVAVTPEDALKLVVATQRGMIRLVLRPVGEHDYIPTASQDLRQVVGPAYTQIQQAEPAAPAAAAPTPQPAATIAPPPTPVAPRVAPAPRPVKQPPAVEVIRGSERERVVP
jgi:pilus assembly protein CpaB